MTDGFDWPKTSSESPYGSRYTTTLSVSFFPKWPGIPRNPTRGWESCNQEGQEHTSWCKLEGWRVSLVAVCVQLEECVYATTWEMTPSRFSRTASPIHVLPNSWDGRAWIKGGMWTIWPGRLTTLRYFTGTKCGLPLQLPQKVTNPPR